MKARHLLAAAALAGGLSCVSGDELASCTIVRAGSSGPVGTCEEVPVSVDAELQASCSAPDGGADGTTAKYANQACSRVGALGGCRFTQGIISATTWWYSDGTTPGLTVADVQAMCASMQPPATFVSP